MVEPFDTGLDGRCLLPRRFVLRLEGAPQNFQAWHIFSRFIDCLLGAAAPSVVTLPVAEGAGFGLNVQKNDLEGLLHLVLAAEVGERELKSVV